MTNVSNGHTLTTICLDLLLIMVLVMNCQAIEIVGDVVRRAGVRVPWSFDGVGHRSRHSSQRLVFFVVPIIISVPTLSGHVVGGGQRSGREGSHCRLCLHCHDQNGHHCGRHHDHLSDHGCGHHTHLWRRSSRQPRQTWSSKYHVG
jgi:hypothetical protein